MAMEEVDDELDLNLEDEQELFEHHHIVVEKGQELLRIDKYLMTRVKNATRSKLQNAADLGTILVNDKAIKSNYRVKPYDVISIVLPHPPRVYELKGEDIPLEVIFEDEHIVLINKPPNMVVHPGFGNYSGTLVNALMFHFDNLPHSKTQAGENLESIRPGLVHRLDKHTTGVMVIAKKENAMVKLAKDFFDRRLERKYWALVWGNIEENSGTVTGHIGRDLRDRKVFRVFPDGEHGKHAVTHYKVLERLGYVTLVECKLETGRTHQIRVHMKHIGHTLFNDLEYGGDRVLKGTTHTKYKQFVENCFKLIPGQALHAKTLGIYHPETKEFMQFEAPLPKGYNDILNKWRTYIENRELE
jgi:23S rRNA pseudouridine1911/1915/1917 synthase